MKKIYMFVLCMITYLGVSAQCFLFEGFDAGVMPPPGWSFDGLPANWSAANTAFAGGTAPEGKFTYENTTATTRFISPSFDLTGLTAVKLDFRHMYDDYTGAGPKLGVATRSHNGTWTVVWEINPTSNVGPEQKEVIISNTDVGQSEFQFCFYLTGNLYNIDFWYFDDVMLFNELPLNAALMSIATPKYLAQPEPVKAQIKNLGNETITSMELAWQLDNGTVHTQTFTSLNQASGESAEYTFTDILTTNLGEHLLKSWISKVNGNPDNSLTDDSLSKAVVRVSHSIPRTPIFEEFTSSTCNPCAQFNATFVPWCEDHQDSITLLKYQMNWPGVGDPYYTEEGGVRRTFYGVNAVPELYCNGGNVPTDVAQVESVYQGEKLQPGLFAISTSWTLTGTVININATVLPFMDIPGAMIQIGVFEELTYNNVATNGETQFEHVMMKMVPDAEGTVADLNDRVPFNINQTVDLSSTNMERWDDVGVVIFVQDQNAKTIYQSVYSIKDAILSTESHLSNILVGGIGIPDFNPEVLDYNHFLPFGTQIIPETQGIPVEPEETVIVVPAFTIPGTTTIDVFAEDLTIKRTYNVNYDFFDGVEGIPVNAISIYPNPTRGKIYIGGADGADMTVVNTSGQVLISQRDFTGTTIDLSSFPKGVYLLNLHVPGKSPVHKRVVLY